MSARSCPRPPKRTWRSSSRWSPAKNSDSSRRVSRPTQTSRQGAVPSSDTPAFNGAKLRFQTTLTSLKMTFATFSQPDNRPYRKSIPPSTKTRKSLLTGQSYVLDDFTPHKRFRTVSGLYMADSTVRPEAFPDEVSYLQHVISQSPLTGPNCQAAPHPP